MQRNNSRTSQTSPYKTAKFRQHIRERSRSPNRSFSSHTPTHNHSPSHNQNETHSTSTIKSQLLWNTLEELQVFPEICLEMLKNQERNILEFKKSIMREKNRITTEIESMAVQITHIIQDFKLSLLAIMDRIYQQYITKYSDLKSQVLQINRLKQQIETQYMSTRQRQKQRIIHRPTNPSNSNLSNLHTIKTIENTQQQLKRFHIVNYIAQMQKEKIVPVNEIAEYLLILTQYQNGFYQNEEFKGYANGIKATVRGSFKQTLDEVYGYIRDPDNIVFKENPRNRDNHNTSYSQAHRQTPTLNQPIPPPSQSQQYQQEQPSWQQFQRSGPAVRRETPDNSYSYSYSQNYNYPHQERQTYREPEINISRVPPSNIMSVGMSQPGEDRVPASRSQPHIIYEGDSEIQQMRTEYSHQNLKSKIPQLAFPKDQTISADRRNYSFHHESNPQVQVQVQPQPHLQSQVWKQQVIISPYRISSDLLRISQQNPFSFKSKAMDVLLCCLYIESNLIAAGSKDGSLIFYDRNGNIIKAHNNVHKSPVCTLALVGNGRFLASGSDHPNPEIILWDLTTVGFEQYCRFREHKGAVTAIQCLRDNDHIISGSYDKRLCVYSLTQRKLRYTLPSNKNSVTALTLNSTGMKLISCCLENNALNIWQIVRSTNLDGMNRVETIFLEQVVENNAMICSVVASALRPNLVYLGTKDGRLKIVDTDRGESIKNMSCCNNALIEMLVIQHSEGLPVILCWPCKEKCFKVVDCQSGKVTNINTKGQLDFSCGVGPKVTRTADGSGFVVCSQAEDREVYWYRITRAL